MPGSIRSRTDNAVLAREAQVHPVLPPGCGLRWASRQAEQATSPVFVAVGGGIQDREPQPRGTTAGGTVPCPADWMKVTECCVRRALTCGGVP